VPRNIGSVVAPLLVVSPPLVEEEVVVTAAIRLPVVNRNFNALNSVHSLDKSAIHIDSTNKLTAFFINCCDSSPTCCSISDEVESSNPPSPFISPLLLLLLLPFEGVELLLPTFKNKSSKHP